MTDALPYWTALLYGVCGAAAVLIGGRLVERGSRTLRDQYALWTAMGAGFLIALGLFSALPEAYARNASWVETAFVAALAFAAVLIAHRVGHGPSHDHAHAHGHEQTHTHGHPASPAGLSLYDARLAIAGLGLHALLDGVAVSAAVTNRHELGIFVAVFVVLHKVPEGAAAAALTLASVGTRRAARIGVWCLAAATMLGATTIFAVGPMLALGLAAAAGVMTGIGVGIASHLFKQHARVSLVGVGFGAVLFALGDLLLHA